MSFLSLNEIEPISFEADIDMIRSGSRRFRAYFNVGDDEYFVYNNCGLGIGNPHPSDPGLFVVGLKIELENPQVTGPGNTAARSWFINLDYGQWNPLDHSFDGNPTHIPAKIRADIITEEVAAFADVDGNPIVNSAGVPYDPPLTRRAKRVSLYVDRNESSASVNLNTLLALSDTVNAATWNGFDPKTVYLNPVKIPEPVYNQVINSFYYPFTYQFDINFDTWVKQVVNAGLLELDGDTGNLIQILVDGQPTTTPIPLDEDGHAILAPTFTDDDGDTPDDTNDEGYPDEEPGGGEEPEGGTGFQTGNLVLQYYDMIRAADFTALNMPTLFTLPSPP